MNGHLLGTVARTYRVSSAAEPPPPAHSRASELLRLERALARAREDATDSMLRVRGLTAACTDLRLRLTAEDCRQYQTLVATFGEARDRCRDSSTDGSPAPGYAEPSGPLAP